MGKVLGTNTPSKADSADDVGDWTKWAITMLVPFFLFVLIAWTIAQFLFGGVRTGANALRNLAQQAEGTSVGVSDLDKL